MAGLYSKGTLSHWQSLLGQKVAFFNSLPKFLPYQKRLEALKLDKRDPPFITAAELLDFVYWKLNKGIFRPSLVGFARSQTDANVKPASEKALALLKSAPKTGPLDRKVVESAMKALCELKGVGPATASAILTWYDPRVPYMGDEALEATQGKRDYTHKAYLQLFDELTSKAKELGGSWTASDVETALWIAVKGPAVGIRAGQDGGVGAGAGGGTGAGTRKRPAAADEDEVEVVVCVEEDEDEVAKTKPAKKARAGR